MSTQLQSHTEIGFPVLKTGLTPSASGSAYLELESSSVLQTEYLTSQIPTLKLSCTVHGPRPLPRSAPFSPQLLLSTRVKFAPFASQQRRGYIPDASERDLAAHLETALRGVLIGERWPKSGIDVVVTVLEGEGGHPLEVLGGHGQETGEWGMMSVLSGCITAASAALTDAGIDCVDLVTGGVAAVIKQPTLAPQHVLDPSTSDSEEIIAACVVGYSQSRDEMTELWAKGNIAPADGNASSSSSFEKLVDYAVEAAMAARLVLIEAIKEATDAKLQAKQIEPPKKQAAG